MQINGLNGKDPKSCKNNKGEGIGMKRRTLALSILTVVCCLGLIVGATLALFNSSSKVDISVTSGDVNVSATIKSYTTYSKGAETEKKGTFENGGKATVDGGSVVLDRISPMDKIVLEIAVSNKSNIAYQYRMKLGTELEKTLYDQLLVGLSEDGTEYTYYNSYVTAWQKGTEQTETTLYLSVELPEYIKSAWQGQECAFALTFEAVQGNAAVTDDEAVSRVYIVESQEELNETLGKMVRGDTVVLGGGEWAQATIAFEDVKTINVRGYKVGVLTVNAPAGTVHYYNDAGTVIGEAIAENSLHVYGEIDSLQLKQGRTVVEAGAVVETIASMPAAESAVVIEVAQTAQVSKVVASGEGETKLDNSGIVENVSGEGTLIEGAVTEESFFTHLEATGSASLAMDITLPGDIGETELWKKISKIDLNGFTMTVTPSATLNVAGGQELTICNGTLKIAMDSVTTAGMAVEAGSALTLDKVVYNCEGTALFALGQAATVNVIDSEISATGYCVATNASGEQNHGVVFNLTGSKFNGDPNPSHAGTAIIMNVPGQLNMKGCTVNGYFHCLIVRGGTAVLEDCTLINTVENDSYLNYFDNRNWGTGNRVNVAALTLGNKSPDAYQYPTDCTLINTKVESAGGYDYPAIYAIGNTGDGLGVTLSFGDNVTTIGDIEIGNDAVIVDNAVAMVKNKVYLSLSDAVVAANNGGTVRLLNGLKNVSASFDYTDGWTNMGESTSAPNTYGNNYYSYTIQDVTIESFGEEKSVLKGLNLASGKVSEKDPTDPTKEAYYTQIIIKGLTFKNISFTDQVYIGSGTKGLSMIDGLTFDSCDFNMSASQEKYKDALVVNSAIGLTEGDIYLIYDLNVYNCNFINCRRSINLGNAKNVTLEGNRYNQCTLGIYFGTALGNILIKDNRIENGEQLVYANNFANNYAAYDNTTRTTITGNIMVNMTKSSGYFCSTAYDNGKSAGKSTYEVRDNYWGAAEGITAVEGFRIERTYAPSKSETILDAAPRSTELV